MNHIKSFIVPIGNPIGIGVLRISWDINIWAINSNWIIAFQSLIEEKCIGKWVKKRIKGLWRYFLRCWIKADAVGAEALKSKYFNNSVLDADFCMEIVESKTSLNEILRFLVKSVVFLCTARKMQIIRLLCLVMFSLLIQVKDS